MSSRNFTPLLVEQHAAVGRFLFEHRSELFDAKEASKEVIRLFIEMELFQQLSIYGITRNSEMQPVKSETKPVNNTLDQKFTERLRNNPRAIQKLIEQLNKDKPTLGTKQRESTGGKKWGHLYAALIEVEILEPDTMPSDFGRAIGNLLNLPKDMIQKISRYASPDRYSKDSPIITNFVKEYKKVWQ